jgi:hypothetical protein
MDGSGARVSVIRDPRLKVSVLNDPAVQIPMQWLDLPVRKCRKLNMSSLRLPNRGALPWTPNIRKTSSWWRMFKPR